MPEYAFAVKDKMVDFWLHTVEGCTICSYASLIFCAFAWSQCSLKSVERVPENECMNYFACIVCCVCEHV